MSLTPALSRTTDTHQRWFIVFIAVLTLWRILFIILAPLDLAPDEAYYWDWSRIPDWGYFSKPPMVAWLNLVSGSLLGSSVLAVRLPAALLTSVGLIGLFLVAKQMYDSRTALWAALAAAAAPGACALGLLMTIDAPLLCCWSLALYTSWRAIEAEHAHSGSPARWWLATTFCIGLGILSKQMMMAFPPLLLLFLALSPTDRFILKKPALALAIIGAFAFLAPVIWWNIGNDWITLRHTAHHFEGNRQGGFFFLITFGEFVGSQFLLISPLTYFLLITVAATLAMKWRSCERSTRLLLILSIVPLVVITLMSLRQRVHPNWPAAFYPAGMILLAGWATGHISSGSSIDRWRRLFKPGVAVGFILALLTYAMPFAIDGLSLGGAKLDPTRRLHGWSEMGREVGAVLSRLPRPEMTFVLTQSRQLTSELAFYLPDQPRVFKYTPPHRRPDSQYDLWPGVEQKRGWDGLIVLLAGRTMPDEMAQAFKSIEHVGDFDVTMGGMGYRSITLYLGHTLIAPP
jgi:4-amino-4-deoxy-L-arabinose transferase-like glycosyltransferase